MDFGPGRITLSFYRLSQGSTLTQLRSSGREHESVEAARLAAVEALKSRPEISYACIDFMPAGGSVRSVEKVEREE